MKNKLQKKGFLIVFTFILIVLFDGFMLHSGVKHKSISNKEKIDCINKISRLLVDYYVFPEIAKKIEKHINLKLNEGTFDKIINLNNFAEKVTKEIQSINHDKHLRVRLIIKKKPPFKQINEFKEIYKKKRFEKSNNYFTRTEILKDNVGLLEIKGFRPSLKFAKDYIDASMKLLSSSDALIIDLRKCGGGSPDVVQYICSYFFDKPTHINSLYNRPRKKTIDFYTFEKVGGKKLVDIPLFILTSSYTFSAAEEFAYDIQSLKRGILIGETTKGGVHAGGDIPISKDLRLFIPVSKAINPITKTNWEGVGVIPEIKVEPSKTYEIALLKAQKAAITYKNKRFEKIDIFFNNFDKNIKKANNLFRTKKIKEANFFIESILHEGLKITAIDEDIINLIGYNKLGEKKYLTAIAVFKFNVKKYNNWNTYDSLGEACFEAGDKKSAIENYEKSLGLNPKNTSAEKMLKKLRK